MTWALVTIRPESDQITPEPLPLPLPFARRPLRIRTVERRRRSATSPNAVNAISFSSIGPLGDADAHVAKLTTTQQLRNKRFAHRLGAKKRMNITGMQHFVAIERNQPITNQEACSARGT